MQPIATAGQWQAEGSQAVHGGSSFRMGELLVVILRWCWQFRQELGGEMPFLADELHVLADKRCRKETTRGRCLHLPPGFAILRRTSALRG